MELNGKERIELLQKIETLEQRKMELEPKIKEHPVVTVAKEKRQEKKQEKERIQKEKSVAKIQRWYRKQYTEKIKYSVTILLYKCHDDIEMKSEEELKKFIEIYKRKKVKYFLKYIYNKSTNKIEKVMFTRSSIPANILIRMNKHEYENYHENMLIYRIFKRFNA